MSEVRRFRRFVFYCLLLAAYCTLFLVSEVSGAVVGEVEIKGLYSIPEGELLDLLCFKPGNPIDRERVRIGIKRAFLKGLFDDICIDVTGGEKVKVVIEVKERDFIENIYVRGDYDVSKKMIKTGFPLKEHEVMRRDLIGPAVTKLKQDLALVGYPRADISVNVEKSKKPNRMNLYVDVNTREPDRIKNVEISGLKEQDAKEIKGIMSLSTGDIYNQVKLKKDLEKIESHYKKEGYFRPIVGPYNFTGGTLDIRINPGKRLNISIKGNSVISTKNLLKELPFFEAGDFNDAVVEEAVNRMLSLYHKKGFPFSQIAPVIASQDDTIDLNVFISEGARVKVKEIHFSGVSLLEKNLREIMSLKVGGLYDPGLTDRDRESIEEFYNALGYLSAKVEEFETKYVKEYEEMDIFISIHEGLKTVIGKVDISGIKSADEGDVKKLIKIKQGNPYNELDILDTRYSIIDFYNTRGFPDAVVTVKSSIKEQTADVTFEISEGQIILFGKTIVAGNIRTKYQVVKREVKHSEGMPYDYRILAEEKHNLYKLGIFSDVNMALQEGYDHKRDVLVRLTEGNAGAVEFGVGYADYERFRGFLNLSYINLWGMNKKASLRFEMSTLTKRAILQYQEPWFLSRDTQFTAFLLGEDRKEINVDNRETRYRLTRITATAGIEKKLSNTLKTELYYDLSNVKTFDVKPDVVLSREDTGTLIISDLRPGIVYDTRDNPFDPRKGIFSGISLKITSPFLLSETNFIKLLLHGSTYRELSKRFVLALSLSGGAAQGYNETDELPIVERFFIGGSTTVRGYDQDTLGPKGADGTPTGGNAYLLVNFEIRSYLGRNIGLVAFLDGGNVWLKAKDINPGDLKYSAGLGFRYNTPVGPIRIDYGYKLQRETGESPGEIHFSIGQAF